MLICIYELTFKKQDIRDYKLTHIRSVCLVLTHFLFKTH